MRIMGNNSILISRKHTFLPHHMIYCYLSRVPLDLAAIYTHIFHCKRVGVYTLHVYSVIILYQLKKMYTQSYTPQRFFTLNHELFKSDSSDINRKILIETYTFPRSCVIAYKNIYIADSKQRKRFCNSRTFCGFKPRRHWRNS